VSIKTITADQVASAVYYAIPELAYVLPDDVKMALLAAREAETNPRGRIVLDQLIENATIAATERVPICQDTGTVWVCLEIGSNVIVSGDVFSGVNAVVARAYEEAKLRNSLVCDAVFNRTNTGNNTPAFCEIHPVPALGVTRLSVMLKGGGSDNASKVVMLNPSAGKQGIIDEVVSAVKEKAPNACAPVIVGVGIGANFDKVEGLAKRSLLRRINEVSQDPKVAELENDLLKAVNATGIGPGGVGGKTTALAVKVNTAPCHIAAMPLAINMGCSAMRRVTLEL